MSDSYVDITIEDRSKYRVSSVYVYEYIETKDFRNCDSVKRCDSIYAARKFLGDLWEFFAYLEKERFVFTDMDENNIRSRNGALFLSMLTVQGI